MKVIDDKDVGKIWRERRNFYHPESKWFETDNSVMLIRKLVAERLQHYVDNLDFYSRHDEDIFEIAERQTFDDFGIKPADWKDDD